MFSSFLINHSSFDGFVKSQESRHSCENRSPELLELTGFPLSRNEENRTKWTFYETIIISLFHSGIKSNSFSKTGDFKRSKNFV
jgi:hypothetical protein